MVHYSVNQAINDKKRVIKIQNSMFTKCDINNTYMHKSFWNTCRYKWNCISYSGCNQDVPNFTIEDEQQISRVSSYMYLVWTSFNEMKKAYFQDQYRCLF